MGMSDSEIEHMAEGRWLALKRRGRWEYASRIRGRAAVVIVALTDAGELLLVEQMRPALGRRCLELPAGLVGDLEASPDESIELAACRELVEETGWSAGQWHRLTQGPPSAGLSDEWVVLLRATELRKVGPGGGDDGEDIEVHQVSLAEVERFASERSAAGVAVDLKLWAGLHFARLG